MKAAFLGTVFTVSGLLLGVAEANAQDSRWAPWIGCWELVNENVRESGPRRAAEALDPGSAAPRVCVTREGNDAVTLTTTVPNQEPSTQTIRPDGVPHPIVDEDCRGTERAEWSRNGQRVFAKSEVTCADGAPRAISGLALITPDGMWLDVRSFGTGAPSITRVSRYQRVASETSRRFLPAGGAPFTLDDLKEAHGKVSEAVLEATLAEVVPYVVRVNKRTLVELADMGVSPAVLDVLVARAYPEDFVVERDQNASVGPVYGPFGPFGLYDYYYSGFYYPSLYYSPFAYGYIGRYDPYYFRPGFGYRPIDGDDVNITTGRAINGVGYTRIRPVDAGGNGSVTSTGRTASPRPTGGDGGGGAISSGSSSSSGGGSSGGSSSGGGSSGGSSSGGGSASPGGFSSGGGGGDGGGRTASPR